MTVESDADLASFFNSEEFAESARYTSPGPGAVPVACSIILDRGQSRSRFEGGEADANTSDRLAQISAVEISEVKRRGSIELLDTDGNPTGETFEVTGMPELDETGRWWIANLLIA